MRAFVEERIRTGAAKGLLVPVFGNEKLMRLYPKIRPSTLAVEASCRTFTMPTSGTRCAKRESQCGSPFRVIR